MKSTKKYMAALASAGFVIAVTSYSHAVTPVGKFTVTASATTDGTPTVSIDSVEVHNRIDDALVTTGLAWTGASPGGGWIVSDQYIKMATTINTTNGGVQIYTDNTGAGASPAYSGVISTSTQSTPAGLVNTALRDQKLPTAWRASTGTLTSIASVNPNAAAGESYLWFFHADKAQVRVPGLNASGFGNGDPFITVYAAPGTQLLAKNPNDETTVAYPTTFGNSGLHFAQGPTQFGGYNASATTYIYTEADFTGALAQATYSTNKLILEAFSL